MTMDGFEYPLPDEEVELTAPTADEADESRAAWQDELAETMKKTGATTEEERAAVRAELDGMDLAWWEDGSLSGGLDVLAKVVGSCIEMTETVHQMRLHGNLPEDILTIEVPLNTLTGPLVLSALQALGVIEPLLRPDIFDLLKTISDAQRTPTAEEIELLEDASQAAAEANFKKFANYMAEQGAVVLPAEDVIVPAPAPEPVEEDFGDSSLN